MKHSLSLLGLLFLCTATRCQTYTLSTFAGGALPDNVPGLSAAIDPGALAFDQNGELIFASLFRQTIFRLSLRTAIVSRLAGDGTSGLGGDGGLAKNAQFGLDFFSSNSNIAIDQAGNIFVADRSNRRVRKISNGVISTLAGGGTQEGENIPALSAKLGVVDGVAVDATGTVYFIEGRSRIRKLSTNGVVSTIAGTGVSGSSGDGGPAISAQVDSSNLAVEPTGIVYINGVLGIRRISNGVISSVLTGIASSVMACDKSGVLYFSYPVDNFGMGGGIGRWANGIVTRITSVSAVAVAVDSVGVVYFSRASRIFKVVAGEPIAIAGNGSRFFSGDGGSPLAAQLDVVGGLAADSAGRVYFSEASPSGQMHRIRRVSNGTIDVFAGGGEGQSPRLGPAIGARLGGNSSGRLSIVVDATGNMIIADSASSQILKVSEGVISVVAGTGTRGYPEDGAQALSASLGIPVAIALDRAGNIYYSDTDSTIHKISQGVITKVAGIPSTRLGDSDRRSGDGGPANLAAIGNIQNIAIDSKGNIYLADSAYERIRKIDITNGIITTIAGAGNVTEGEDIPLDYTDLTSIFGIAFDSEDNLFISEGRRIRKVTKGLIRTIAGNGVDGSTGEGVIATNTSVSSSILAIDNRGSVFFSDTASRRIRVLTPSASQGFTISTEAALPVGSVGAPYSQGLAVTGGMPPYNNWTLLAGQIPPGLALASIGGLIPTVLSGVPSVAGTFAFTLQVSDSSGAVASRQFTVVINSAQTIIGSVVNAASYAAGEVAPGEIVTLFGSNMGPTIPASLQLDASGSVAKSAGGVQVMFDGVAAPILYAQGSQVSAIVPYAVAGRNVTQVQLKFEERSSNIVSVPVVDAAPGVFTIGATGQGAIINQDGTINSSENPASKGTYVFVYATGEGQTNPGGIDGRPATGPAPRPLKVVTATIGGLSATVQYAGGVPGIVAGLMQVNVLVPQTVASGNFLPIFIAVGDRKSQSSVTVSIK